MPSIHRSAWVRYGAAVGFTAIALALKLLLVPLVTQDAPFLLFFAAVMAAAGFGGLGPGLLATGLAAALNDYFFMEPFGHWRLTSEQSFRLLLFAVEGVFISIISARLKTARQRAEDNAAEARELERRILEISDTEQRRIGHDLHDGLGQHLTGIALIMRRLQQRLSAAASPESDDARKVSEMAGTAVAWTHDLCRSLSPPVLESAGLAQALEELAANAENIFNIRCTFEPSGPAAAAAARRVDLSAGAHLYRIAQEAISNAVRHGKSQHVRIKLDGTEGALLVQVLDDGSGIVPEAQSVDGMGLRIMRYRANMIGASIEVRHNEAGGTIVTCRYSPPSQQSTKNANGSS